MLKAYTHESQDTQETAAATPGSTPSLIFVATPQVTLGELVAAVRSLATDVESSPTRPSADEICVRLEAIARELVVWDACVQQAQTAQTAPPVVVRDGMPVAQPGLGLAEDGAGAEAVGELPLSALGDKPLRF